MSIIRTGLAELHYYLNGLILAENLMREVWTSPREKGQNEEMEKGRRRNDESLMNFEFILKLS